MSKIAILKSIFYNTKKPGGYSGTNILLRYAKKINKNITKKDVTRFLLSQKSSSLWAPRYTRYKRNSFVQIKRNFQFSIDLMFLVNYSEINDGFKYLLTTIDVFSRQAHVFALRTKKSEEVLKSIKYLVEQVPSIKILSSDLGTEFFNKNFKLFCKQKNIGMWFSENREIKQSLSERFHRTLRQKLLKMFTHRNKDLWIDQYQNIVKNYNNTFHRTLGCAPNEVTAKNQLQIARKMFPPPPSSYIKKKKPKFKKNNYVRLQRLFNNFEKNAYRWTREIFKISKIFTDKKIVQYQITDKKHNIISGKFYGAELKLVVF